MSRANCLVFSLALYARRRAKAKREGRPFYGYLMVRRSFAGPFPHVLYVEIQGRKSPRVVSYGPLHPKEEKLMPPPCFEGRVRWGDPVPKPS